MPAMHRMCSAAEERHPILFTYVQMQNEIDRMLAGQFNAEDDAELSAELAALMGPASAEPAAPVEQALPAVPTHEVNVFPSVPTGAIADRAEEHVEEGKEAVPA